MHLSHLKSKGAAFLSRHLLWSLLLPLGLCNLCFPVSAQDNLWQDVDAGARTSNFSQSWVEPDIFRALELNHAVLQPLLASAPVESVTPAALSKLLISLPQPDGTMAQFRFVEAPVMAPELGAQFPEIRTYLGQNISDPATLVRFDITPAGFHAQILSPNGAVYIDPYLKGDTNLYACYYKRDFHRQTEDFQCFTTASDRTNSVQTGAVALSGANLRTYRLACAATGEYTQFQGGTVSAGLAAIVTAINRVTGVYETELAIRLVLVASNNLVVYTNAATDPYDNANPSSLLSQNQSTLDGIIGSANYDIGHVFSTAGGGLSGVGVVCIAGLKAFGETGTSSPVGDPFYIDYVAHEMGHQFGANHPFNGIIGSCNGNRHASTAYEPGSGSTIMSYAGICGSDNLQAHSDPYFHSISLEEIANYVTSGNGASCGVTTTTGNDAPIVSAGASFIIPKATPFLLTASATDPNGDTLTYCWEERDLGPAIALGAPDNGSSPLFRSFSPTASSSRTFPRLQDILNQTVTLGEMLPVTNRTMQFRVTSRDNHPGGGGVSTADMQVTVSSNAGPFVVTSPNTAGTRSGLQMVTWDVAGTSNAPINAASVNIWLSTNGGLSFPFILASNVPNTGAQSVLLPNLTTSSARIKVEAVSNIFFDISDANFSIVPAGPLLLLNSTSVLAENCSPANGVIDPGETVFVNFALTNAGNLNTTNLTVTLVETNGVTFPSAPQSYGSVTSGGAVVSRTFSFTAAAACGGTITAMLQLQDGSANLGTLTRSFNLGAASVATQSLTNAGLITINGFGAATPYPSSIIVSNIAGTVTKVTVTLQGLSHTFPDDIDVLLVGPGGQNVLLMSDTGGGNALSGINLTFDDNAAASLPDSTRINSGTYKPTNIDTNTDAFPPPAPAGPFGQTLSVFNGLNPTGTWSLFVQDDTSADAGSIAQGWTLSITTSNLACCTGSIPTADLAIGESISPNTLNVGSNLTCTLRVTNFGPNVASGVVVTSALPTALNFVSAISSQGSCTNNNGVVTCSLGSMTNGATALVTLSATAVAAGALTNVVAVSSSVSDPVSTNNLASASALVNAFPTISVITNQVTDEDTTTSPIPFVIGDAETPAASLTLSGISSNTNLVANSNIVFGGTATNRTVTLTPSANQFGTTTISITVSDGAASAVSTFTLTVNSINDPPVLAAITNYVINEGATLLFTNQASDVDLPAQTLTFSLDTNAPPGATINPTNGIFNWTPTEAQGPSTNLITVRVTDNGLPNLSATQSFSVIVLEVNSAPVFTPVSNQTALTCQLLTVTNIATDSDLPPNALLYSLTTNAPVGASINPTNGIFTWTPTSAQGGSTNIVTVIVTDDGTPSLAATQSFSVVVVKTNPWQGRLPVPDQTVIEGQTLVITNLMVDPNSTCIRLLFSLATNAPAGASVNSTNGVFTWTPTEIQGPSTNLISIYGTEVDFTNSISTQSFTVVVLESNSPPVLAPLPDRVIHAGATLTVSNSATDPDLPANSLTFSMDSGAPPSAMINPSNGLLTISTSPSDENTTNLVTVRVTDDGVPPLSDTKSFTLTVLARPVILSITLSNSVAKITWSAIPGQAYRLQYLETLSTTNWNDLSPDVTAAGPTAAQVDSFGSASSRFYRVMVLP
jgi:uncharacterized repeat protein (TIGR01451 family)